MKHLLYKLLFVLCLLAGTSCSQPGTEEATDKSTPATTGVEEDTTAAESEVPASLQQH